jgi:hypothetical protein
MADTNLIYPYELEGGKKAVADEVMANFEAIQLVVAGINTEINNLTTVMTELKKKPTREMMDIYYSFSSQAPTGAFPLWTGETLTNAKTLYPQFWKKINQLASDGAVPSVATEEEYEEKVAKYGQCASFFINTLDGHVRLPKITQFISSIEQLTDIGEVEAGLPNITGNIWVGEDGTGWPDEARDTTQAGNDVSYVRKTKIFNASEYNELYGKSDTVQPPAVRLYLYLQVVNNATEISELNVSVIAEQLNDAITELEKVKNQYLKDLNNASEQALKGFKKETTNFYTKTEVDSKISSVGIDNKITNCILEIPQDIKLELNNGTLTLKAGSKLTDINETQFTITSDYSINVGQPTGQRFLFAKRTGSAVGFFVTISANIFSGATQPTTTIATAYWYDTQNKVMKITQNTGQTWSEYSGATFPIASVIFDNGKITSLDQVFNGFGYIGSTVFALPGVKGLIPNGRNADGSLKNVKFTTTSVSTLTLSGTLETGFTIANNHKLYDFRNDISYDDVDNFNKAPNGSIQGLIVAGNVSFINSRITSFNPKFPFRAVDYNELEKRIGDIDSVLDSINGEVI